jgi:RimJ/RimL family protein N-acetyltransferase
VAWKFQGISQVVRLNLPSALVVEVARKQELEILQLTVYASNERAFHVYKKCDFRQTGRLTKGIKFLDGTYTNGILMELLLKQPK